MKIMTISIAAALAILTSCGDASAWRQYRSPYGYYRYGPNATMVWGIPRYGYWGPRWQRDPYWIYNRYRYGW